MSNQIDHDTDENPTPSGSQSWRQRHAGLILIAVVALLVGALVAVQVLVVGK